MSRIKDNELIRSVSVTYSVYSVVTEADLNPVFRIFILAFRS